MHFSLLNCFVLSSYPIAQLASLTLRFVAFLSHSAGMLSPADRLLHVILPNLPENSQPNPLNKRMERDVLVRRSGLICRR